MYSSSKTLQSMGHRLLAEAFLIEAVMNQESVQRAFETQQFDELLRNYASAADTLFKMSEHLKHIAGTIFAEMKSMEAVIQDMQKENAPPDMGLETKEEAEGDEPS